MSAASQLGGRAALKSLRRKFIFTNMLFVGVVLVLLCAIVLTANMSQNESEVYQALSVQLKMSTSVADAATPQFEIIQISSTPEQDPGAAADEAQGGDGTQSQIADSASQASDAQQGSGDETSSQGADAQSGSDSATQPAEVQSGSDSTSQDSAASEQATTSEAQKTDITASAASNAQPTGGNNKTGDKQRESKNDAFIAITLAGFDSSGNIVGGSSNPLNLSEETMADAIEAVKDPSTQTWQSSYGKLTDLNLYYQVKEVDDGYIIALASINYIDQSGASLFKLLAGVSIAVFVAFFIMSLFLSKWALRPVEDAWNRQQRFIADASHELKTPLTVILANNSILMSRQGESVESQMQWVESTETEAHLMQGLVNDMLYLARSDDSEKKLGNEHVDMSDIVRSSVLQFESVAFEHGVMIQDDIANDVFIQGDSAGIQRLVGTLVDNACKYVDRDGSVSVSLNKAADKAVLRVNNSGAAIPEEDIPHLFDRFYRADKSRTRSAGGFGLGLAIARSIVQEHNGTIGVESTDAQGTTFMVTLPLARD